MSVVISIDIIACVLNKHQVSEGAFGTVPQTSRRGFYILSFKGLPKSYLFCHGYKFSIWKFSFSVTRCPFSLSLFRRTNPLLAGGVPPVDPRDG